MAFSDPTCANAYRPHMGLSSMVLQRKCLQGHTGHMIRSFSMENKLFIITLNLNLIKINPHYL